MLHKAYRENDSFKGLSGEQTNNIIKLNTFYDLYFPVYVIPLMPEIVYLSAPAIFVADHTLLPWPGLANNKWGEGGISGRNTKTWNDVVNSDL